MNRQSVNSSQGVTVSMNQILALGVALVLTLAAGLFYHSVQTARLADQVAAQTALLAQMKATQANTLVKAAQPLSSAKASPATVETVVPQQRWVF